MRRLFHLNFALLAAAGCATASSDEHLAVDSGTGGQQDGSSGGSTDAAVTPPDGSTGCTTMTRDLLANGNLDGTPVGTGWTAMPAVATDQLVTPNDGVPEQTAPNKAWLGGIAQANATDVLYQDVMVPASTTMLVLTGYFDVRTSEIGTTVYDTGKAEITQTSGTLIEAVLSLDNAHPQTAWQAINHPVAATVAGQTIRIRLSSKNDGLNATSFYFDTLALQATYCE